LRELYADTGTIHGGYLDEAAARGIDLEPVLSVHAQPAEPKNLTLTKTQASEMKRGDLYIVTGRVQLVKADYSFCNPGHIVAQFDATHSRYDYCFLIVAPTIDLKKGG